jgi:hypothetical protein
MAIQPDKSDIGPEQPPRQPPAPKGIAWALVTAALIGAILGVGVGVLFATELIFACALGGALLGAAVRVALLLSSDRRGLAPLDDEDGTMQ